MARFTPLPVASFDHSWLSRQFQRIAGALDYLEPNYIKIPLVPDQDKLPDKVADGLIILVENSTSGDGLYVYRGGNWKLLTEGATLAW